MAGKVGIVWEEPPEMTRKTGGAIGKVVEALGELKKKPNAWARVAEWDGESGAYGARARLNKLGHNQWNDGGRFEFEVRRLASGGSGLWARYVVKAP
jgi:hypothetical protein